MSIYILIYIYKCFSLFSRKVVYLYILFCILLFKISLSWRSLSAPLFSIVRWTTVYSTSPLRLDLWIVPSLSLIHTALQQIKVSFGFCAGEHRGLIPGNRTAESQGLSSPRESLRHFSLSWPCVRRPASPQPHQHGECQLFSSLLVLVVRNGN